MSWRQIEESRTKPPGKTVTVHVVWRCKGCGALAVTGGEDPGKCLKDCKQ